MREATQGNSPGLRPPPLEGDAQSDVGLTHVSVKDADLPFSVTASDGRSAAVS